MLHAVIIITASGLILFQKEFALLPSSSSSLSSSPSLSQQSASYISLSSKSGQLAGIITAVINFSLSRLGGQVSYIQTDHVGVALAVHPQTKCTCAVFHQVADGEEFGRLMAKELLQSFANTYRSLLSTTAAARSDLFSSFGSKISGIISSCIRPVLDSLAVQPGILLVLCCQSDSFGSYNIDASTSSTSSLSPNPGSHSRERLIIAQPYPSSATATTTSALSAIPTLERLHSDEYRSLKKKHGVLAVSEVHDTYSVLSAHDALLSLGSEILSVYQDGVASVELKGRDSHVWMKRWHEQRNSFIVVYQANMEQHVKHNIAQTAHLLHKGQT